MASPVSLVPQFLIVRQECLLSDFTSYRMYSTFLAPEPYGTQAASALMARLGHKNLPALIAL